MGGVLVASIINANNSGIVITTDLTASVNIQTANITAISIDSSQNANITSTGAIVVPAGTTAQRPTATNGMIRYNTSNNAFEVYTNSSWKTQTLTYLPVNSVAPVISGSAVVGQTLSSTTGTWSNSPTSYGYQWLANAVAISSATSNTFTLTSTQNGANITCNVTATNKAGTANAVTSNTLGPVINQYTATYLVVAGGAGGQVYDGGGGGAGGYRTSTVTFVPGTVYTATVGGGGGSGASGTNSSLSGTGVSITSTGGGTGGSRGNGGASGGSGGGGGQGAGGGAGTAGQGNNGGSGNTSDFIAGSGGGGGAGSGGGNGGGGQFNNNGGPGGSGATFASTGNSYCGGGGGGSGNGYSSSGGGGGGSGAGNGGGFEGDSAHPGGNASANSGSGGGGASFNSFTGGNGGSGIIVLVVPTASYSGTVTGGVTVTTSGSNKIITFTSSGTYTG